MPTKIMSQLTGYPKSQFSPKSNLGTKLFHFPPQFNPNKKSSHFAIYMGASQDICLIKERNL